MNDSQLQILLCPECRKPLRSVPDFREALVCPVCGMIYPVCDDIPFLFKEAALPAASPWQEQAETAREYL